MNAAFPPGSPSSRSSAFSWSSIPTPLPGTTYADLLDSFPALESGITESLDDCSSLINHLSNGSPEVLAQLNRLFTTLSSYVQALETNTSSLRAQLTISTAETQALQKCLESKTRDYDAVVLANTRLALAECQAKARLSHYKTEKDWNQHESSAQSQKQPQPELTQTFEDHLKTPTPSALRFQMADDAQSGHQATCSASKPPILGTDVPIFDETSERMPHKRQFAYTNWCSLIRLKLALDSALFSTPYDRILYTCTRLGADSYGRVRAQADQVAAHRSDSSVWPQGWTDFESVFKSLDQYYIVFDVYTKGVRDFENLYQRDSHFANFMLDFHRYADDSRQSDEQRVAALKAKINSRLRCALHQVSGSHPGPGDVHAWVDLLQQLSNDMEEQRFGGNHFPAHRCNEGAQ